MHAAGSVKTSGYSDEGWSRCEYMQVQALIGAKRAMAFDLTAACSGFVVGLITAAQFIRTGQYKNIIIIGADALSRYVDWRDRGKAASTTSLMCPIMLTFDACAHGNGVSCAKIHKRPVCRDMYTVWRWVRCSGDDSSGRQLQSFRVFNVQ